ncbi:GNAT family N-acetyltransferase [Hydrogenophaga sp. MI9]|uniref:GNAT family N-acetyltransferase n=1 Tax=Hydrogenophaga sp. MI9 TaxID=3453719 RepID=UPI003EE98DCB
MLPPLPPFPSAPPWEFFAPPELAVRGVRLRPLALEDVPWLLRLYESTREEEMAQVPWPESTRRMFLEQQFGLQHRHYVVHCQSTQFLAIESGAGETVGNFYLQRIPAEHRIVHISLFPVWRSQGIGSALIRQCQQDAAREGLDLVLHVLQTNPSARRLYERMGFRAEGDEGAHTAMRWSARSSAAHAVS